MPVLTDVFKLQLKPEIMRALLADAAEHGVDPARVVAGLLERKYAKNVTEYSITPDEQLRWDSMTPAQQQSEIDDIAAAFEDFEAGRFFTMDEVLESARVKFGIEVDLPRVAL